MSLIGKRITPLAMAGILWAGLSTNVSAQMADTVAADTVDVESIEAVTMTIYRTKEPPAVPAAKAERKGRAPSKDAAWIPGFWNLQGDRNTAPRAGWTWIPGRWMMRPFQGAQWIPAHWGWAAPEATDRWWSWIPGHWSKYKLFIDQDDQ
jgi:hypothetical protein